MMAKPPPSDFGRLSDGQTFQVMALDVSRALAHAGMTNYEQMVMQVVIEQSWYTSYRTRKGPNDFPEPIPCRLSLTMLANDFLTLEERAHPKQEPMKALRNRLSEAKRSLIRDAMLLEDEDGLWVNKDASTWGHIDPKTKVFTSRLMRGSGSLGYARSCQKRISDDAKSLPEIREIATGNPVTTLSDVTGNPVNRYRKNGKDYRISGNENGSLVKERASEEKQEENTKSVIDSPGDSELAKIQPQTEKPDPIPPELERVLLKAESLPSLGAFGPSLRGAWSQRRDIWAWWPELPYPDCWCNALVSLSGRAKDKHNFGYFLTIVQGNADKAKAKATAVPPKAPKPDGHYYTYDGEQRYSDPKAVS